MSAPSAAKLVFSAFFNFGTSGVDAAGRSWGKLATTLVVTIFVVIFNFFPPSQPFLIEGLLESKNLFSEG